MALSFRQILFEARDVLFKLNDGERKADDLLARASTLHLQVCRMKQPKEDTGEWCADEIKSNVDRFPFCPMENKQMRRLQDENGELKGALHEHRCTVDLVMQHHARIVTQNIGDLAQLRALSNRQAALTELTIERYKDDEVKEKRDKFPALMEQCFLNGEYDSDQRRREIDRLKTENASLRHLLKIGDADGATSPWSTYDRRQQTVASATQGGDELDDGERTPTEFTITDTNRYNCMDYEWSACRSNSQSVLAKLVSDSNEEF